MLSFDPMNPEENANTITHGVGAVASVIAGAMLVGIAATRGASPARRSSALPWRCCTPPRRCSIGNGIIG